MQIVGGRWEVCLGDCSCELPFFPSLPHFLISAPWDGAAAWALASPLPADSGQSQAR